MAYHAGYNAKAYVEGSLLCVTRWSVNDRVDELDVSNMCSKVMKVIAGVQEADISIEGHWDDTEDPFGVAKNFTPGQTVDIELYPDIEEFATAKWDFPTARIVACSMEADARGTVRYAINAKSDGAYTRPDA